MLQQDNVCDLIVEAIRKNQHMLLIPKTLSISLVLGRLEGEQMRRKKENLFYFFIRMSTTSAELEIQNRIGLHDSMKTFIGHHEKFS